jgi:hypothetical protein
VISLNLLDLVSGSVNCEHNTREHTES